MSKIHQAVTDYFNNQPHPKAPGVRAGDFPLAVRLASAAKFGGHATPPEAEAFWKEFQQMHMSPAEFEQMLESAAPHSFALHGRPPSMTELTKFGESKSTPSQIREHYAQLPDKNYPELSAGEMIKNLRKAEPWAQAHLGRKPVKKEAVHLHHSGMDPQAFFQAMAAMRAPQQPQMPQDQGGGQGVV